MQHERNLLVVSGPSGCGKDTVVQIMAARHSGIEVSVSATTRPPRFGEAEGTDYYFLSAADFEARIARGELLEYTRYIDNYYGTLKSEVDKRICNGIVCVLVIEVTGADNVKRQYPNCTTVFILPPNMQELERRLRARGTESEERLQKRLRRAEEELLEAENYDFTLVNDDAQQCAEELYALLQRRRGENTAR